MKRYMYQKWLLALGLLWSGGAVVAQQRPYYTQYILNNYIINPAVAGIEDYWDVKLSHRHQWTGLEGSPVTTYLTIHGPLKKSDYPRSSPTGFDYAGSNPRGQAYWENYQAPPSRQGIGFTIMDDKAGYLNRFAFAGSYAYHIGIAPQTSLSAGISLGMQQLTLETGQLVFQNPSDPVVSAAALSKQWKPDVSAGLWLYSSRYFAGLAVQNILPQELDFGTHQGGDSVYTSTLVPHVFVTTGYRMYLDDDISFLPSVMVRYARSLPLGVDVNAKFQYRDLLWAGAVYRYREGIGAMAGINISYTFNIGYAYDYTTSALNTVSKGTHEILLGFMLGNRYRDLCPRNVW